ncbi:unnamed protein product [Chironomus riparius]|uniref:Uncharacterized protein n=1 Tax=Chironomus riparius TaxID=315576 RepID=A0A9N9WM86_9DIPT|nr:unnamed protein product [Chironomus riparius]
MFNRYQCKFMFCCLIKIESLNTFCVNIKLKLFKNENLGAFVCLHRIELSCTSIWSTIWRRIWTSSIWRWWIWWITIKCACWC